MHQHVEQLIQDQYGNYVIQHVLGTFVFYFKVCNLYYYITALLGALS